MAKNKKKLETTGTSSVTGKRKITKTVKAKALETNSGASEKKGKAGKKGKRKARASTNVDSSTEGSEGGAEDVIFSCSTPSRQLILFHFATLKHH
jgi:hypothetical protein